jgi:hypothetical protein
VASGVGWLWHRHRKARPLLMRWADENHYLILSSGFWSTIRRRVLMDRPPYWKWWSYPFQITVRTERGQIEEGWVLCHHEGALAAWDSGRVRETKWGESKEMSKPETHG